MGIKLRDYFKETDAVLTIYSTNSFGSNINRTEIETSIIEAGYPLPTQDRFAYIVDSNGKAYFVRYFAALDKYGIEKLTMK